MVIFAGILWFFLYSQLPVDGSSGDLSGFGRDGFQVKWILEDKHEIYPEDVIQTINGRTIEEFLSSFGSIHQLKEISTLDYEILRDGRKINLQIQITPLSSFDIAQRYWPQLFIATIQIIISGYLIFQRPGELAARILGFFTLSLFIQILGDAYNFQPSILALGWPFWMHFAFEQVSYTMASVSIVHFILVFPFPNPWFKCYAPLKVAGIYLFPLLVMMVTMALSPSWSTAINYGNQAIIAICSMGYVFALFELFRKAKMTAIKSAHAQIQWIIACALFAAIIALPGYFFPLALGIPPFIPLDYLTLFLIVIPVGLTISVVRYHLFDIEIAINKSLVYSVLTIFLAGVYYVTIIFIQEILFPLFSIKLNSIAVGTATLITASIFSPARDKIQNLIDRRFYREKLDIRSTIVEFTNKVRTTVNLDELLDILANFPTTSLNCSWGAICLNDKYDGLKIAKTSSTSDVPVEIIPNFENWVKVNAGEICEKRSDPYCLYVPLYLPGKNGNIHLIGTLILGAHVAKREYRKDEIQLIRLIADHAGAAITNAQTILEHEKTAQEQISLYHKMVLSLAQAIEARDPYTCGHSEVIASLSTEIGKRIGFTEKGYYVLNWAGLLHDVGKIGIRDSILYKQSKLTDEEWQEMKKHPDIGAHIVSSIPGMERVSEIIRCHHENFDGSGYPNKLSGLQIPVEARIIRVVDSFLAMTDHRPYNRIMSPEEAIDEIKRCSGKQYDPMIVKIFVELHSKEADVFLHGRNLLPESCVSIPDYAVG